MMIYKILRGPELAELIAQGESLGAPIDRQDGYVHFSTAAQLAETAARHFAGVQDLSILAYEADDLGAALKWEVSRGGALFPHLYAPLRAQDIRQKGPLLWAEDGAPLLPDWVI